MELDLPSLGRNGRVLGNGLKERRGYIAPMGAKNERGYITPAFCEFPSL